MQNHVMSRRLLTVQEAARYLRLNPRSVYLLAQRGAIPATRVTGKWLFPEHLLDEWLEAGTRGGSRPPARKEPPDALFAAGSDDPAIEWLLAQSGEDPNMGARPLRRAIQKHVEDPVSELLIAAREERLEAIEVRVGSEGLRVTARESEPITQGR